MLMTAYDNCGVFCQVARGGSVTRRHQVQQWAQGIFIHISGNWQQGHDNQVRLQVAW